MHMTLARLPRGCLILLHCAAGRAAGRKDCLTVWSSVTRVIHNLGLETHVQTQLNDENTSESMISDTSLWP